MDLPLFPLHTVLCPGVALPLLVFEDRYRALVAECLERRTPFGVVLIHEGREVGGGALAVAAIGTFAEIREAQQLPDGRYEILAVGTGRFAVEAVETETAPYLVGRVSVLPDVVGDEALARALTRRVTRQVVDYLRLMRPRDGEDAEELDVRLEVEVEDDPAASASPGAAPVDPADDTAATPGEVQGGPEIVRRLVIPDDPTVLSYLLSGLVQLDNRRRQALLEADTSVERLAELGRLLRREITLLGLRLRPFSADPRLLAIRRN